MPVSLDANERAYLAAYLAEDPDAEAWIAPWSLTVQANGHGADTIACTFDGAVQVGRRLCQRKLLEGNGDRGKWRGYSITDKGKAALA